MMTKLLLVLCGFYIFSHQKKKIKKKTKRDKMEEPKNKQMDQPKVYTLNTTYSQIACLKSNNPFSSNYQNLSSTNTHIDQTETKRSRNISTKKINIYKLGFLSFYKRVISISGKRKKKLGKWQRVTKIISSWGFRGSTRSRRLNHRAMWWRPSQCTATGGPT